MVLAVGSAPTKKNACFRSETAKERLDLTSYMRYTNAKGRGPPWPTAVSIHITHITR
jgi:hypothetical protein